jgi:hypothetical protein
MTLEEASRQVLTDQLLMLPWRLQRHDPFLARRPSTAYRKWLTG